jgi:hypothetical protein
MIQFALDLPKKRIDGVFNRKRVIELFSYEMASRKTDQIIQEIFGKKSMH